MPNYVDAFKNQDLYATNNVKAFRLPDPSSTIVGLYYNGEVIGTIYSYINDRSGGLWWMIYENNDLSQMPFYIYNDAKSLSVPDVNQPLTGINTNKPLPDPSYGPPTIGENIANGLQNLSKSLGKYLPLIIGGVVLIALLPTINQLNRKK
jgi:hypothetical protein